MEKALSNGLLLRSLSAGYDQDRAGLKDLYKRVFGDELGEWNVPDDDDLWVDSLLSGSHPTITDDDVWVVVDPAKDDLTVSTVLLIPQLWRYEAVELPVGRPELVATHPDYRRRGLVRELMQVAHARSEALGHVVQGITGIDHYYRRFGYTMAVDLDRYATTPMTAVPKLKDGQQARYTLRLATEADYPQLCAWDDYVAPQFALSTVYTPALWAHHLGTPGTALQVIVDDRGKDVGFVALRLHDRSQRLRCQAYVVGDQSSYLATYDDVLRGLKAYAEANSKADGGANAIEFDSGLPPTLHTLIEHTEPSQIKQDRYAWYMRAASPARLIETIKPVLEARLQGSGAHRYTGAIKINFHDLTGLRIQFDEGRITGVESIDLTEPKDWFRCDAAFPYHTFLNLVFGHRTYREIKHIMIEAWATGKAEVLLNTLFPVKPSHILAVS